MTNQYIQFSKTFFATINVARIAPQVVNESMYGATAFELSESKYPEITTMHKRDPIA